MVVLSPCYVLLSLTWQLINKHNSRKILNWWERVFEHGNPTGCTRDYYHCNKCNDVSLECCDEYKSWGSGISDQYDPALVTLILILIVDHKNEPRDTT